ncbi:SGNH/GDSL hydrolase family protein [Streptomyces gamaensis]|uniref:SGNH/GDSL hydrolase family protein n=1 Tax=Streptomyces gamaensis TaxID=1763542 RepID=A0ABW0ZDC7_9ACTN
MSQSRRNTTSPGSRKRLAVHCRSHFARFPESRARRPWAALLTAELMITAAVAIGVPSVGAVIADGRRSTQSEWRVPQLVVMPLGDSITYGTGSSTGSGYRAELRNLLASHSKDVRFVGSQRSGEAPVREHEGHYGWKIGGLTGRTGQWLTAVKPNVVLLHIGTNDMHDDYRADQAPERLGQLVDEITNTAPGTTVLVSSLVPSADRRTQNRIKKFNAAVLKLVTDRRNAGFQTGYVDMGNVTTSDLRDELHPNDNGYHKMAGAFYRGIATAANEGWIRERTEPGHHHSS